MTLDFLSVGLSGTAVRWEPGTVILLIPSPDLLGGNERSADAVVPRGVVPQSEIVASA
jgi:hypothetical protein